MNKAVTPTKPRRLQQRPPFQRIALLLQGGGALGAYQGGVYQALAEADLHPDWVAGISIGAVNSALIAGNPPEKRVAKLREFWEGVSETFPDPPAPLRLLNQTRAFFIMLLGAPHFFTPRWPPPVFFPQDRLQDLSFYDTAPLRATLERLVDFDRINHGREMRFSVGAVNVQTGNLRYFDNATDRIGPAHVMASGSLPPGLPATKIDGDYYWDGGVVSNTPLQWMLESNQREDTLAFQIDLWNAAGDLPRDFGQVDAREKDIRYASRTNVMTDQYQRAQKLRVSVAELLKILPQDLRETPQARHVAEQVDEKVCNIVHLIYRSKSFEGISKDFQFSRRTMEEHWRSGFEDAVRSLEHPEVLRLPDRAQGVRTFDLSPRRA